MGDYFSDTNNWAKNGGKKTPGGSGGPGGKSSSLGSFNTSTMIIAVVIIILVIGFIWWYSSSGKTTNGANAGNAPGKQHNPASGQVDNGFDPQGLAAMQDPSQSIPHTNGSATSVSQTGDSYQSPAMQPVPLML